MPRAIVLGGGMVGSVMAADLAAEPDFTVTIADVRPQALSAAQARGAAAGLRIETITADLADSKLVKRTIAPFDIVLGAIVSPIGFQTLRAVIEAGKPYCDITFMPEDAWELDALAKQHGVTAIVDCGVAPGMSNMIAGYAAANMSRCDKIEIYVGGLPRERRWPFQYKAAFSPYDVIEEYTRPSRIVEHGRIVVKEALSEPESLDFPGIGTLEAFNTDGLRSLAHFLKVPFMKEKTMRYPGHIELMRAFREIGLFRHDEVELAGGKKVRPIDLTSALMFPKWTYEPGEEDLTVMRVIARGQRSGRENGGGGGEGEGETVEWRWDLLDFYDRASQSTSMSRTTAFPCTIMARMVARGEFNSPGVLPPELIGQQEGMLDKVLKELEQRGVRFVFSER